MLAPERIFNADTVAAEVLKRCDGKATLASILDQLAAEFSTPRERIEADVRAMLEGTGRKAAAGVLRWNGDGRYR